MAEGALNTPVRLPLLNKMLLASDHVGLQAIQLLPADLDALLPGPASWGRA